MEERREAELQIARLEVQVKNLEDNVGELKDDVKKILEQLAKAEGSWKTLLAVAGFSSSIGAAVSWAAKAFIVK